MGIVRIFADSPSDAQLMGQEAGGLTCIVETPADLLAGDDVVDCVVVGCRSHHLAERVQLLGEVGRRLPWVPVILVTDRDVAVARVLSRVNVAGLVWFDELATELRLQIESSRGAAALRQLAEKIRRSDAPPALRAALVHSLRQARSRPVRNVQELAAAVGCSPVTLFQQFGARAAGATTLNHFLGALAILRAQQLRGNGSAWKAVSTRMGFRRETLNRKARRWPGCTLSELDRIAPDQLLAAFIAEHFQPVLERASRATE